MDARQAAIQRGGDGSSSNQQLAELNQALKFSSLGPQGDVDMVMETIVRFDGDGFGDTPHGARSSHVNTSPVDRAKRTSSSSPSHRHSGNVAQRGRRTGNTAGMVSQDAGEAAVAQSTALGMGTVATADGNASAMIGPATAQHPLPGSSKKKKKKKKKQPQRPPPPSGSPPDRDERADWDHDWARDRTRGHEATTRRRERARSARLHRSGSSNPSRLGMDLGMGIGTGMMGDGHSVHRQGQGQGRSARVDRRERARMSRAAPSLGLPRPRLHAKTRVDLAEGRPRAALARFRLLRRQAQQPTAEAERRASDGAIQLARAHVNSGPVAGGALAPDVCKSPS